MMKLSWNRLVARVRNSHRRRRVTQSSTLATVGALEQRLLLAADFGDAPASYPVVLANSGAEHEESNYRIGTELTTEPDGQPSANADADVGDDGVYFGTVLIYPGARGVEANISLTGVRQTVYLDAWMDFNIDGDWDDPGEHFIDSYQTFVDGTRVLFDVPSDAVVGTSFTRIRVSKDPDLTVGGQTDGGEVEDYQVEIVFPPPRPDGLIGGAYTESLPVIGTQRPTITWPAVPDAAEYELYFQRSTAGAFETGNRVERYTVSTNQFTLPFDLPIQFQTEFWTRSFDSSGTASVWSPRYLAGVYEVSPDFTQLDLEQPTGRPLLEWSSLAGANKYDLWVSNVTTNSAQVIRKTVEHTSAAPVQFVPEDELPLGRYRAWVRAGSPALLPDWSTSVDFQVMTAPQATQTAAGTFDRTPEFTWTSVKGAATYDVQVKDVNTGQTVHDVTGITGTSWTPASDLADGPYRWQVVATGAQGQRSFWSAPVQFYAGGRSEVLSPAGNVFGRRQTITWASVEDAASWDLQVMDQDGVLRVNETGLTGTSFNAIFPLFSYGSVVPMRAWVRAVSTTGEVGVWSAARDFTVIYE
jgi:hypothetical protein